MSTQTITRPTEVLRPSSAVVPTPSTRSVGDNIGALPSAIRSEWVKVTSLRSNLAIGVMAAVVSCFATWAIARFVDEVTTTSELLTFPTVFVAVFAATAGILMFTSESQHGTLTPTMTGQPSRAVVATSKMIVAAVIGLILTVIGLSAALLGSVLGGNAMGETATMVGDASRAVLYGSLAATLGLGVGMIARQSAAAISGLLAWWLLVENLVTLFVSEKFTRFMPFTAGNNLIGVTEGPDDAAFISEFPLTATQNALVFAAYAVTAVAIGTALLYKRDDA